MITTIINEIKKQQKKALLKAMWRRLSIMAIANAITTSSTTSISISNGTSSNDKDKNKNEKVIINDKEVIIRTRKSPAIMWKNLSIEDICSLILHRKTKTRNHFLFIKCPSHLYHTALAEIDAGELKISNRWQLKKVDEKTRYLSCCQIPWKAIKTILISEDLFKNEFSLSSSKKIKELGKFIYDSVVECKKKHIIRMVETFKSNPKVHIVPYGCTLSTIEVEEVEKEK